MSWVKVGLAVVASLALTVPDADAGGRGRGGGGRASASGARHPGHHFRGGGVFVGGVYGYPYYYYPAYYPYSYPYYDQVPLYPPTPTDPYWYYCRAANAYYPYVQACAGGWERYLPGTPSG